MATEPTVKTTETDPGQPPLPLAGVSMSVGLNYTFEFKDTRESVIKQVTNCVKIPLVDRSMILARIAAMNTKHRLIRVSAVCHPHKGGSNFTFTLDEI